METIADKSRTKEIIEKLQNIIDEASPVPLASGKVMVYKDEVRSLLSELATQMDMEIKTYHEVNDRRGKIINEAKREAEKIIYQAENTASRMRVNKRTTNVDPVDFSMLTQEELNELDNANEIYGASLIYTDEMLTEVSNLITDAYDSFKEDCNIILKSMEEKILTLSANKEELMNGLSEMDAKDRSQQIIEIGQLLSNELFTARMNSRRNPDMYDDGSMQLTFDLTTEQEMKTIEAEEKAREAEEFAREAGLAAKEAEAALAQVTAQRDALIEEVSKMRQESIDAAGRHADIKEADTEERKSALSEQNNTEAEPVAAREDVQQETEPVESTGLSDDDDYEIVYVTEDELEDGEEYEIEYVDEDELQDGEEYEIEYVDEDELQDGEEYETEYVDEDELRDGEQYESENLDEEKSSDSTATNLKEDIIEDTQQEEDPATEAVSKPEDKTTIIGGGSKPEDKTTIIGGASKPEDKATIIDAAVKPGERVTEVNLAGRPDGKQDNVAEQTSSSDTDFTETEGNNDMADADDDKELPDNDLTIVPITSHFAKPQKIASVPAEKVAKMASAITTDKKYSGLISKAVSEKEQSKTEKTKENDDTDEAIEKKAAENKDTDETTVKKTAKNNVHEANMYIQEQFEITEF